MSTYSIRIEQTGDEFECDDDETILEAAFRSGYNLASGCREGRCSACKGYVLDGYIDHKPHSTFALSETEEQQGFTLLCRAMPETDVHVELMHFDPDSYRLDRPIVGGRGRVASITPLTHDIVSLVVDIEEPSDFGFNPGQYLDLWVPGHEDEKRSYSVANLPGEGSLEFVIKRYPGGYFSELLDGSLQVGDEMEFRGPYGSCSLRERNAAPSVLLIGGGSGMGPMLSLLRHIAASYPERRVRFFYGGREQRDLFYTDQIEQLGAKIQDFEFIPVLSAISDEDTSWQGERGFVHHAVGRWLTDSDVIEDRAWEVYMCGPQVMVDEGFELIAARRWVDERNILYDSFTITGAVTAEEQV